jgi:hypothetical protein
MRPVAASGALLCVAIVAAIVAAPPAHAQAPEEICAQQLEAIEAALTAEGPRRALFAEHLALVRESHRRGEAGLCLDLAEDLLSELLEFDA